MPTSSIAKDDVADTPSGLQSEFYLSLPTAGYGMQDEADAGPTNLTPGSVALGVEATSIIQRPSGESFEYEALTYGDSIRLLEVEPSLEHDGRLQFRLLDAPLSSQPTFEILSCFWSGVLGAEPACFCGRSCSISVDLDEILRRFRSRTVSKLFWIEPLCVDIRNSTEQDEQAALLPDIIRLAHRLIIWLGAEGDDSGLVFEHLGRFSHMQRHSYYYHRGDIFGPVSRLETGELWSVFGADTGHLEGPHFYPGPVAKALASLCSRPWFHRPQSQLEAEAGGPTLLVCGGDEFGDQTEPEDAIVPRPLSRHGFHGPMGPHKKLNPHYPARHVFRSLLEPYHPAFRECRNRRRRKPAYVGHTTFITPEAMARWSPAWLLGICREDNWDPGWHGGA